VTELQLAHLEENDVRRAYVHAAEFWNERVEMMQVWADYSISFDMGRRWIEAFDRFAVSQG